MAPKPKTAPWTVATEPDWVKAVRARAESLGIPEWVWMPIMLHESSGNPDAEAVTSTESSHGLYQINIKANPGYAQYDLNDPLVNAEIGLNNFILPAWNKVKSRTDLSQAEKTAYVWKNGIRPKWTEEKNQWIQATTNNLLAGGSPSSGETATLAGADGQPWWKKILSGADETRRALTPGFVEDFWDGLFGTSPPNKPPSDGIVVIPDSPIFGKGITIPRAKIVQVVLLVVGIVLLFIFAKNISTPNQIAIVKEGTA